ncbi:MAG TPA: protease inhibitor I42 family protein [Acidimicrobiia bacterium]|nr:protease inhibitor I42 family protein [Acidimicrobiia bacterium]
MRRLRAVAALLTVGVGVGTLLGACSGDDSSSVPKLRVFHESDTSVSVAKGTRFVFALPANPSTGYSWKVIVSNPTVVHATGSKQSSAPGAPPGAAGTQRLSFTALGRGTSMLELVYDRPFAQGSPGNKTVDVTVTVR